MAPEKTNDPFVKLQSYTNFVLLRSGRLFQDSSKRGGQRMLAMRRELKKTLPGVLNSYHDVLDTFDTELQLARRALRKELAARQAQRIERERAEEEQKRKKAQPRPPPPTAAKPTAPKDRGSAGDNDVIMLDGPGTGAAKVGTQLYTDQGKPQETIAKSAPKATGQDKKRAQPEAIKIPSPRPADAMAATDFGQTSAGGFDDLFEGKTPTTAAKDFDLDSIFNDMGPGDAMNVDADAGDIDFSFPAETTDNSGGVSGLLPGLENYSDIGNDMNAADSANAADFQFDIPGHENATSNTASSTAVPQATGVDPAGTGDSNFDDLLADFDYSGSGGLLDGENGQFDEQFWGN